MMELIGLILVLIVVGLSYGSGYMNGHADGRYDATEEGVTAGDVLLAMPEVANDNEQAPRTKVRPF